MKKIIDDRIFNTKTAKKLGEFSNMNNWTDPYYYDEELYQTKKGQYFMHTICNSASMYNNSKTEDIVLISKKEAIKWLKEKTLVNELEKYFSINLEEG